MGRTRLLLKQLKLEMLKKTLSVVYLLQIKAKILFITKIQEFSKTCVYKRPLSNRQKIGFQDQISLNAGQKYRRMLPAILLTFIKLPFVIKIFVLSIFGWPFYTGLTVD